MENTKLAFMKKTSLLIPIIGYSIISVSLFVFVSSIFHLTILTHVSPLLISRKMSTALCFILSGIALICLTDKNRGFIGNVVVTTSSLIICTISGLTLYEYITGFNIGIDQLFFKDNYIDFSSIYPGRIAVIGCINFFLSGIAYLFLIRKDFNKIIVQFFVAVIFITSLVSLYDYTFGINTHKLFAAYTIMSVNSDISFILISLAILLIGSRNRINQLVMSKSLGNYLLRGMLPIIFIVPVMLIVLERHLEKTKIIDENLGDVIVSAGLFIIFFFAIACIARLIDKGEAKLIAAQKIMVQDAIIFREFIENIDIVFFRTSPNLDKIFYISPAYEKIWKKDRESLYKNSSDWLESIVPEDKKNAFEAIHKGLSEGKTKVSAEFHIKRCDESVRNIYVRVFQLKDPENAVFCNIGIAIDITNIDTLKLYGHIQQEVAHILETKKTINEIFPATLHIICKTLNWDLGEIWLIDEASNILRCVNIWHKDSVKMRAYENATHEYIFKMGEGFPEEYGKKENRYGCRIMQPKNISLVPMQRNEQGSTLCLECL